MRLGPGLKLLTIISIKHVVRVMPTSVFLPSSSCIQQTAFCHRIQSHPKTAGTPTSHTTVVVDVAQGIAHLCGVHSQLMLCNKAWLSIQTLHDCCQQQIILRA